MELREEFEKINENSSLKEVQAYLLKMQKARGFEKETLQEQMILLTEEVGELARAIRKQTNMKQDTSGIHADTNLKEEIADVFMYLTCMCINIDVQLIECFKEKEEKNFNRTWK